MNKTIQASLILLLISFRAHGQSEVYFVGGHEEAKSACDAHVASLNYVDNYCPSGLGWAASWNLCTSGTPYERNCGEELGTFPDRVSIFYYYPLYVISDNYDKNNNVCTVGNPVDPVSGSKVQREPLINIAGNQSLIFDLYYNSANLDKWKHSYGRGLAFSKTPTGIRYDMGYSDANGYNSIAKPETNSFLGSVSTYYGAKHIAPIDSQSYLTKEGACQQGWYRFKDHYKFSWVNGSVAEYRSTPISSFGAIGQCYILDAPEGNVKMVLDILELFSGVSQGYAVLNNGSGNNYLRFLRETGEVIVFSVLENFKNLSKTGETVEVDVSGAELIYRLHTRNDEIEEYSGDGKLLSITSAQGHVQTLSYSAVDGKLTQVSNQTGGSLTFSYETYGGTSQYVRIKSITDHTGRTWIFNYDAKSYNLTSIENPEGTSREFHYEDPNDVQLLTGISDETNTRYATWEYDIEGRAKLSAHGVSNDKDRVEITYADSAIRGLRVVSKVRKSGLTGQTDNISSNYYTHPAGGKPTVAEITGVDPIKFEHNAATGYLEYVEDKGQRTEYSNYDSKGNPGVIKEAVNTTEQRETSYTYDSRYHSKVASIIEASVYPGASKVITNQYDDFGNNTSVTIDGFRPDGTPVSRTTTFTYNGPFHQLTQIDGPRTDVSDTYIIDYYADDAAEGNNRARMKRVTAPLGITLYDNISYTPTGKINTYVDTNYVLSTLSYYFGNDRLQSLSQLDINTGEERLTEWTYRATGEVETITTGEDIADKTTLTFNYDDARRLTSIVDGLGNTIEYILDSEGNVEQENIRDMVAS